MAGFLKKLVFGAACAGAGILAYKNQDTIKEYGMKAVDGVKDLFGKVSSKFSKGGDSAAAGATNSETTSNQ